MVAPGVDTGSAAGLGSGSCGRNQGLGPRAHGGIFASCDGACCRGVARQGHRYWCVHRAVERCPTTVRERVAVVVFTHGSSGLGLKAIGEWQQWLAEQGIASVAPDSFALPDRLTYKSPISPDIYERIHALRLSEVSLATQALRQAPWADPQRWVLAGTREGAAAVARYQGQEFLGRIVFSWSCENNYFVRSHGTALPDDKPVLNIISSTDPYFSPANSWLGNPTAAGHCAAALRNNKQASIVLIPGAPHTVLNLPAARHPVAGFLRDVFKL